MEEKQLSLQNDGGRVEMNGENKKKDNFTILGIILFLVLVLIDQVTKLIADAYMDRGDSIPLIEGWLAITFTYNRGISYGMGSDASPLLKLGVILGTAVMMAAIAFFFFKLDPRRKWLRIAFVFVVAGGVGNLIDRLYYQVWDSSTYPYGVRDMVDLSRFGFAVCNFADFFISAGAVMMVLGFIFFDQDAIFPQGKYKLLAKEAEAREAQKSAEKSMKQPANAQSESAENLSRDSKKTNKENTKENENG